MESAEGEFGNLFGHRGLQPLSLTGLISSENVVIDL
jgi:hypothetical protein